MDKKVLIIGGTGRLSKDVVNRALLEGYEVYTLNRGTDERKNFVNPQAHTIIADIRKTDVVMNAVNNLWFDVIVDFISFEPDNLKNKLLLFEGKYKQYIFISSATVYSPTNVIHSETDIRSNNVGWSYCRNKYECERFLKNYFLEKEEKYTIVRPYVTYGNTRIPYPTAPRNSIQEWTLLNFMLTYRQVLVLELNNKVTLTHSNDFAKGLVGLFCNEKSYNEDFHITSQEVTSWEKVIDICIDYLKIDCKKKYVSVGKFTELFPEYYDLLVADKSNDWIFNNQKLIDAVPDFSCMISLENGLHDMIENYLKHPEIQKIDTEWETRMKKLIN